MSKNPEASNQIETLVKSEPVVLFMKGSRSFPQCGFSAAVVQILNSLLPEYKTVNVLSDPDVRQGIKDYSSWPTIPQLYIGGEFVGGCDIVKEMFASGELQKKLGVEAKPVAPPEITITPTAAAALKTALADAGADDHLHIAVSSRFEHDLEVAPPRKGDVQVSAGGLTVLVDAMSVERARGLIIDFIDGPDGAGFKIDNPNAPKSVRGISPAELKQKLESGTIVEFYDTRGPDERARASIQGARPLDEAALKHIQSLDRSTPIALHCHHGGASGRMAQQLVELGFREVYNLAGGIDAWSKEVDPNIPRY